MLYLQQLSYNHPDKTNLFDALSLSIRRHQKTALTGPNGSGKSTLLRLIAGQLQPAAGSIQADAVPYYVPQHFGQYDGLSIARALQVDTRLHALRAILDGDVSEANLHMLQDDWAIEERCTEALMHWQLSGLDLNQPLGSLSGGQKTRVFLAGIRIHQPELVLLDEPSNHLDTAGRQLLYDWITGTTATLLVVSHDRRLLNLLGGVYELGSQGLAFYGGNYDFYREQKQGELDALNQELKSKEQELRKARAVAREALERQQKLNARGRKKQVQSGLPTIAMNTLRNQAEQSTARIRDVHAGKTDALARGLQALRQEQPAAAQMRLGFDDASLHRGKELFYCSGMNFAYNQQAIWPEPLELHIRSGERLAIQGPNGSGKTTLIGLITGKLQPLVGQVYRADFKAVYVDQDYGLIDPSISVFEQLQRFNSAHLLEHELKNRLNRFLFTPADWHKACAALSGGERMRLMLCCLDASLQAPDMIVLDEPTNNLDLDNLAILSAALRDYRGSLLVVSHDAAFLEDVGIERLIGLG